MIGINFVIIDLEFNNVKGLEKFYPELIQNGDLSVCNECPNEIIQIGAIKLDKSLNLIDSFEAHVKPVVYSVFNPAIKELTGINEEDLDSGVGFTAIMELLRGLIDKDSILCSWAKDDITEIIRNCSYHKYYDIQWIKAYIDLQDYCTKELGLKDPLGLKRAMKLCGINYEDEKLHNALNDALYTGEVLKKMYNPRELMQCIIKDVYKLPVIHITDDAENLDKKKLNLCCPNCGNRVNLEIPFEHNKWKYKSIGHCKACESKVFSEIAVRKNLKGEKQYKNSGKVITEREYSELCSRYKLINNNPSLLKAYGV